MATKQVEQAFPPNLSNLLIVLTVIFFVFGCFCRSEREIKVLDKPVTVSAGNSNNQNNAEISTFSKNSMDDKGDFIVEHAAIQNEKYKEYDNRVKTEKILEKAANQLNQKLKLPFDVFLRTKTCGEANAIYNPNERSITVCYELMDYFFKIFKASKKTDEEAYSSMLDAVRFVFLHELGHAMIDAYKLPITGNEEDAADRASAYICLEEIDDGVKSVLAAAYAFDAQSKGKTPNGRELADEHLLEEQRFYNSLCMIYGSNTVKYESLLKENHLPKERAARCQSEYEKTTQGWKELLKPWRKE